MTTFNLQSITTIVGLGNPGPRFELTRHNIGFLLLDMLADQYGGTWRSGPQCEWTEIFVPRGDDQHKLRLVKPQTFMNTSGDVWPWLAKQGTKVDSLLIVHDELEKKFGHTMIRKGGSARGHNGLRSFIARCGADFWRLRLGIDRPENKSDVANYVLRPFTPTEQNQLTEFLEKGIQSLLL